MSERLLTTPEPCRQALVAIEADPLNLPSDVQAHLRGCVACTETRVQWLAQEDVPAVMAPAGYFERLPDRVLRKLPARRLSALRNHPWLWLAAAGLALTLGAGGFLAGRVQRTPVVEASLAKPALDATELISDTPFKETDDVMSQFSTLNPQEAEAVLKRLELAQAPRP
jgi:hypothetical protein